MKTFLINEVKKKTTKGGKGLCRVFLVIEKDDIVDITRRIAELGNREKQFDGINLTIHYGSGTGQMVISEIIKKYFYSDANIVDVSIF